jgi:chitodextrinase
MASFAALASVVAMIFILPGTAYAVEICEKFGSTRVQGGRYVIQNNNWGDDTTQCINTTEQGFTVTTASHNKPTNGSPGSYPSVFAGCHWSNCSSGSGLPLQASSSQFNSIQTSVSYTFGASSGTTAYNASYDLWFDPTPRTDGQNTGAEIMIWLNRVGSIQPVGSQVGTANIAGATWDVWFGNIGWNVVSYVRQTPATSINFAVNSFYSDAVNRGHAQRSWYLTSVQAGYEPWVGGVGLQVNNFTYSIGGGTGGDTTPPSAPGTLSASGATSSSVNLSWAPSSDNVGVAGYDVLRAPGTSGGTFNVVGAPGGTSFNDSGLSANTTYRYQVRARDAAGNTSNVSNTVTVTTTGGGGTGTGGCTVQAATQSSWPNGYVLQVTVTNSGSSTMSGWSVPFTLPSGHQVTGSWGAGVSPNSGNVTATNLGYNGSLAPNQSVSWGFQASRPSGSQLPALATCNAS